MPYPARMAQIPKLMARLQFGLQFNTVPWRPGQTDQGRWTSLNRSGQRRPELLMRLRGCAVPGTFGTPSLVSRATDRTVSCAAGTPARVRQDGRG